MFPFLLDVALAHLDATRVEHAPKLDGDLADAAWVSAPPVTAFTQKFPNEASAPSDRTTLRVVYDDDSIYFAFDCEQTHSKIVERLTRRGRLVESDWVSVALGTRGDGKSAFEFTVNASGVQVDTLRFNDTETSENWDENWEAQTKVTASGWTAEIRIPLHTLRFATLPLQSWDFQARRYISERQETDEWAFIPRAAAGEVSHYGRLDGLRGLTAKAPVEIRPFVLGKLTRRDAAVDATGSGVTPGFSAGVDLKWHPTHDLALDLTLNPDFATVEADTLVVNLTTYETFYPEKRPFFLEGVDLFETPVQLVYTRRIGRVAPLPTLRTDPAAAEQLVDLPAPATIIGASKLTGRIAPRWTFGAMQAVTLENDVQVSRKDGSITKRLADPMSSYDVLRLKRDLGDNAHVGLMTTAVTHVEPTSGYPSDASGGATQLCPNGAVVSRFSRCFNDALVGAIDWRWRSSKGDWVTEGQAVMSQLQDGPTRRVRDGTLIAPGDRGFGLVANLNKEGGKHLVGDLRGEYNDRKLDVNDLGFDRRANNVRWRADVEYRELEPWWIMRETHARFEYFGRFNLDGHDLGSGYQLNYSGKLKNKWEVFTEVHYRGRWFDDREVGDGTSLERGGLVGYELELQSDKTKRVSFAAETQTQVLTDGLYATGDIHLTFRVLPQFDLEIDPSYDFSLGEPRFVGQGPAPGQYLFGRLSASSIGSTLRAGYTFTPRISLQAYAQIFLSTGHYADFSSFQSLAPRSVVHLSELRPYGMALAQNPDFVQGVINVNVVGRWEYRLGSTLYLVYTRTQAPNVVLGTGESAGFGFNALGRAPAIDVFMVKISYWWG